MQRTDTVITGIGIVTALGLGRHENWENLCAGRPGVGRLRGVDESELSVHIASQVPERFEGWARDHLPAERTGSARAAQLCSAATDMAIEDGGLDLDRDDPERVAVVVGCAGAGLRIIDERIARLVGDDPDLDAARVRRLDDLDPGAVLEIMGISCSAQQAIRHGIEGPTFTICTACASGAAAVAAGDDLLQLGKADVVLVGGTDALVSRFSLLGFSKLVTLSGRNDDPERASRPFDRDRDGFVLGEGAAMMVLETAEHARRRGATPYACLLGHASTSEAFNITAPAEGGIGMARAMACALRAAHVAPEEVDYVSAHGTSTTLNDQREAQAINRVFGDHARRLWVSSQKSMIGHTIGAAGAIEAAVTALTIRYGVVTPTINYEHPDPECDLDVVPNVARERRVRLALSNSFGFGGHNCTLVLGAAAT